MLLVSLHWQWLKLSAISATTPIALRTKTVINDNLPSTHAATRSEGAMPHILQCPFGIEGRNTQRISNCQATTLTIYTKVTHRRIAAAECSDCVSMCSMLTYTNIQPNAALLSTLQKASPDTSDSDATFRMDYWSSHRRPSLQLSSKEVTTECLVRRVSRAFALFTLFVWNSSLPRSSLQGRSLSGLCNHIRQHNFLSSYPSHRSPDLALHEYSSPLPLVISHPTLGKVNTTVRLVELGSQFIHRFLYFNMQWKATCHFGNKGHTWKNTRRHTCKYTTTGQTVIPLDRLLTMKLKRMSYHLPSPPRIGNFIHATKTSGTD